MKEETLFVYTDSVGNITKRRLASLTQFKAKTTDHIYFKGFDLDARAMRTFRADRMQPFEGDVSDDYWQNLLMELPSLKNEQNPDNKLEVLFTGFPRQDVKPHLESLATKADLLVRKSFTSRLGMLVCGNRAGPKKIDKAQQKGIYILSEEEFIRFLDTGEVPVAKEKASKKTPTVAVKTKKTEALSITHLDKPKKYFSLWAYRIIEAHWGALGVKVIYPVDDKKTQVLKSTWRQENPSFIPLKIYFDEKIKVKRKILKEDEYKQEIDQVYDQYPTAEDRKQKLGLIYERISKQVYDFIEKQYPNYADYLVLKTQYTTQTIQYQTYGYQNPPNYDFHEGDIFYATTSKEKNYLQLIHCDQGTLEVNDTHNEKSVGYHISPAQLADWLKTGDCPPDKYLIDKNQSFSEIAKLQIYTE